MNDVYETFLVKSGWAFDTAVPISPDASNRKYFRLSGSVGSVILMDAKLESLKSYDAFQDISEYLIGIGLSAPKIYASDRSHRLMLLEDLGPQTFAQDFELDQSLTPARYEAAVSMLCQLQAAPKIALPSATPETLTQMLYPFFEVAEVHAFLSKDLPNLCVKLQNLFHRALINETTISLRDCHAENLVWIPDRIGTACVGVLDFQDAFKCDPCYDLVSLLWDVRRDLHPDIRERLIASFAHQKGIDRSQLNPAINVLKLQRNLRILGVFDRLISCGKTKYATFIPRTLQYVHEALATKDCSTLKFDLSVPLQRYSCKFGDL